MKVSKIALLLAVVLLLALAASTMATEANWRFNMVCNPYLSSYIRMATTTGATDGMDSSIDTIANVGDPTKPAMAIYDPLASPYYMGLDTKSPITAGESRSWEIRIWVGTDYASDYIGISWLNSSPSTIGGMEYQLKLKVVEDPTGTYTPGTELPVPYTVGYAFGPVFTNLDPIRYNQVDMYDTHPNEAGASIKLTATIAPVPEPGSMLALGAGLAGLASEFIRKRR